MYVCMPNKCRKLVEYAMRCSTSVVDTLCSFLANLLFNEFARKKHELYNCITFERCLLIIDLNVVINIRRVLKFT